MNIKPMPFAQTYTSISRIPAEAAAAGSLDPRVLAVDKSAVKSVVPEPEGSKATPPAERKDYAEGWDGNVYSGVYRALKDSLQGSLDPMLDELSLLEGYYKEASARYASDDPFLVKMADNIQNQKERIQQTADWITNFYGKSAKSFARLQERGGQGDRLAEWARNYASLAAESGNNLDDPSSRGLGIDKLEGDSSSIRLQIGEALDTLDSFIRFLKEAGQGALSAGSANSGRYLDVSV